MFDQLEILRMSHGLARHAAARQAAIAQNVANVNTPGYAQVDVPSFAATHASFGTNGSSPLRATRPGHLDAAMMPAPLQARPVPDARQAPNGNSVSLETEIVKAAETRQSHDMALTIYQSALSILRAGLGRR